LAIDKGKVIGLIIVGATLDSAAQSTAIGGWDVSTGLLAMLKLTAVPNPDFAITADDAKPLVLGNLGPDPPAADAQLWTRLAVDDYRGDAGRARMRQCATNWLSRDSLHARLPDVRCPALYVVGGEDGTTTEAAARAEAALFGAPGQAQVEVVPGGFHAPLWTHAADTRTLLLEFIAKNNGRGKAQALREAVGMVDI
jgi:pimeloyl-ACP methyl ester carboxylesterase